MKAKLAIVILIVGLLGTAALWRSNVVSSSQTPAAPDQAAEPRPTDRMVEIPIVENSTFGNLMAEAEIDSTITQAILEASSEVYDLSSIRVGRTLQLHFDIATDEFTQLVYQISSEADLSVTRHRDDAGITTWVAERKPIDYEVKIKTISGTIETSMYDAALKQGIDERAIIAAADAFQWSVDFALDPRVGDTFTFIYEERYRDGQYVMPGTVLGGVYRNAGTVNQAYYFAESDENTGYFDENGNSVQKLFLKAPVAYRYISSGFTTGRRYIQAFNISTGHRAIDYAAAAGTPIRAVGDGTVTFAGWSSQGYGRLTSIRHNGTYSTNYAHQSKIIVKVGQKVSQGRTIGYVGSTGLSTGPHLHYEMVKNGVKINPLLEVLPPGTPIKEENKQRFFDAIKPYQEQLLP
ncbi:MAG: hypothetical protein A3J59_00340 [Candidatus Buchananbacteria bacterium RIFCSPHIGHO2_02_FULL_56_16]|uniref:Uncharacterized protein n=1 Tax=Candidatus Buchananbacteria bacterium RIFCSPHIGHO2_02_FULL_56_16 TaxID=1797542 RepID=A0A1G1YFB2_9BACT|nr:MAG: hypothetical protein A3J59_00340 [Candidatus Buchananbacteria bacterium RIFCSPHIGHO2_02_FULL_56_16]